MSFSQLTDDAVCEVGRRNMPLLLALAATSKELRRVLQCWLKVQVKVMLEHQWESTRSVAAALGRLAAAPGSRLQHVGVQGRDFPVRRLLTESELDFVTSLGARNGAESLDTTQAALVAPLLRQNRALRRARVTSQAGALDLARIAQDSVVDLRGVR